MIKWILVRIGIVLIGILVVVLGRGLFYYSGFYHAPARELPSYEDIAVPVATSTEFSDVYEKGEGIILIDLAHNNAFDKEELNILLLRLVSRGLTIKFFNPGDDLKRELLGKVEEEEPLVEEEEEPLIEEEEEPLVEEEEEPLVEEEEEPLVEEEEELPRADAFIVVCPKSEFSKEEGETIDEFVNNGGKLLLIADPTRPSQINSVSLQFGLIFEAGYLYNMKENDTNYRNIFVAEFKESKITTGLRKIALYTAGSISSAASGVAFVDENTFSNLIETRIRLSPMALSEESKILAIHDLTFMMEPYNGILDNNQLISNIADWLMFTAEGAGSK